jgi:hypothetical protein
VNQATGASAVVGTAALLPGQSCAGHTFDNSGTLYTTVYQAGLNSDLYKVDPSTANATLIGNIGAASQLSYLAGIAFLLPPPPPPPPNGGGGTSGGSGGEGIYGGTSIPTGGFEGSYGFGGGFMRTHPAKRQPSVQVFHGPFWQNAHGEQTLVKGNLAQNTNLTVLNVSHQNNSNPQTPASPGTAGTTLFACTLLSAAALGVLLIGRTIRLGK